MIDTHSHIYDEAFDADREEVILRAKEAGVTKIILPNVDDESLPGMLRLQQDNPGYCYAAIGLHPTSVKEDYHAALELVGEELKMRDYVAIGEIGIDLYWDKTYFKQQEFVFRRQIEWALEYELPVIIHVRDSFRETMDLLSSFRNQGLTGVFHSFTGTAEEAAEVIDFGGFRLGVNGIATFKNSHLRDVLRSVDIEHILLETDAPYLTPVPFRGKRNESSYLRYVAEQLSAVYNMSVDDIDRITTKNALNTFKKLLKPF